MKPPPKGWPRISPSVFYEEAAVAIDWLCEAFGFEVKVRVEGEGGTILHSQLTLGEGMIMLGQTGLNPARPWCTSPRALAGASTQALCVFVDDADAHCERARAAGAKITEEPATQDYGDDYWADRTYSAEDPEGHHWYFMQRLRDQGAE